MLRRTYSAAQSNIPSQTRESDLFGTPHNYRGAEAAAAEEERQRLAEQAAAEKAELAEAARLRAQAEEEAEAARLRAKADAVARAQEEARLLVQRAHQVAVERAAAEQAAARERLESIQRSTREAELRELALEEDMKRVRMETQVAQERMQKLREEAKQQEQVQAELEKASREYGEATRRRQQEQEQRLRAMIEAEEQDKQAARENENLMSAAAASSGQRMAPLVAAEDQAKQEVQAMRDRARFVAEAESQVRDLVEEAQGILEAFQAPVCAWIGHGLGVGWAWVGRGLGMDWAWVGCINQTGHGLGMDWTQNPCPIHVQIGNTVIQTGLIGLECRANITVQYSSIPRTEAHFIEAVAKLQSKEFQHNEEWAKLRSEVGIQLPVSAAASQDEMREWIVRRRHLDQVQLQFWKDYEHDIEQEKIALAQGVGDIRDNYEPAVVDLLRIDDWVQHILQWHAVFCSTT